MPIDYWDGHKPWTKKPDDGLYVGPSEIIATPVFYNNRVYVAIGQDPLHGRGKGCVTCIDATKDRRRLLAAAKFGPTRPRPQPLHARHRQRTAFRRRLRRPNSIASTPTPAIATGSTTPSPILEFPAGGRRQGLPRHAEDFWFSRASKEKRSWAKSAWARKSAPRRRSPTACSTSPRSNIFGRCKKTPTKPAKSLLPAAKTRSPPNRPRRASGNGGIVCHAA